MVSPDQVTLVSSFRKFLPPYDAIQRRVLASWQVADIPAVVAADQVGVEVGLVGYSNVEALKGVRSGWSLGFKTGACLVNDLLLKALPLVQTPMAMLVGSDMEALAGLREALEGILAGKGYNVFLDCGRGTFLSSRFWLRKMALDMPDFIIGRPYWADWTREWARRNVDGFGTVTLPLGHCDHDGRLIWLEEKAWGAKAPSAIHNAGLSNVWK